MIKSKRRRLILALGDMCKPPYPTKEEVAEKYGLLVNYIVQNQEKVTYSQAITAAIDIESEEEDVCL